MVIGGHFPGGDHFDGGDHFGGGTARGSSLLPRNFRFKLNSATKVEVCSLTWTAVNGSYSFQVLSVIVRLCRGSQWGSGFYG